MVPLLLRCPRDVIRHQVFHLNRFAGVGPCGLSASTSSARSYCSVTPPLHDKTQSLSSLSVLFFGTDDFALPTLQLLHDCLTSEDNLIRNIGVVTPPIKRGGRGGQIITTAVRSFAETQKLDILTTPLDFGKKNLKSWELNIPKNDGYDLGVVVSFGYFIPPHIVQCFPLGAVNLHPSLLPRFRGAAPIPRAVEQGMTTTGVSIVEVSASEFDSGDILHQSVVPIKSGDTSASLFEALSRLGAEKLVETIRLLPQRRRESVPQDPQLCTHAPKVSKSEGKIEFSSTSASRVSQQWKAFHGIVPLFGFVNGKRFILHSVSDVVSAEEEALLESHAGTCPGAVVFTEGEVGSSGAGALRVYIRCNPGWLRCGHVQREGKAVLSTREFVNGYLKKGSFKFDE